MKSGWRPATVRSSPAASGSAGAITFSPQSAAVAATVAYHCVSCGSSGTVTTSAISTPAESSVLRQRTPTSWWAKTTARVGLTPAPPARAPRPRARVCRTPLGPPPAAPQRDAAPRAPPPPCSAAAGAPARRCGHVFPDHSESDERDSDQEEGNAEQREQTLGLGADDQTADREVGDEEQRDHGDHGARQREELQRRGRKSRHQVEVEADQTIERVLGLSQHALRVRHLDLHRMACEGVGERRY